jgi:hypothetical protein
LLSVLRTETVDFNIVVFVGKKETARRSVGLVGARPTKAFMPL